MTRLQAEILLEHQNRKGHILFIYQDNNINRLYPICQFGESIHTERNDFPNQVLESTLIRVYNVSKGYADLIYTGSRFDKVVLPISKPLYIYFLKWFNN